MSRSKWKKPFQDLNTLLTINNNLTINEIKIMSRSSTISKYFLNQKVAIHNGNSFKNVFITEYHLGYKFGEFAFTRKNNNVKKSINVIKKKIIKKK
jgi:small subunit ribosomal protein S19